VRNTLGSTRLRKEEDMKTNIQMSRIRLQGSITLLMLSVIVLFVSAQSVRAQQAIAPPLPPEPIERVSLWDTDGENIFNMNSSNVGVGTNAPGYQLDVVSTAGIIARFGSTAEAHSQVLITAPTGFDANLTLLSGDIPKWYLGNRVNNNRFAIRGASGTTEFLSILQDGKVGIGTTTPGATLDVAGTNKAQAFNLQGVSAEKAFVTLWNNGVANQKVQVYWPAAAQVDGIYEITVTGDYWYSNSNGGIRKRIAINGRNIGIINMEQSEVPFRMGFTGNTHTISDIMWDAANSRYYFIVANLDNAQNLITVHVKSITPDTMANADSLNITPIYTSDITVYPQLYTSFMGGNVGIGTSAPATKLHVVGDGTVTGNLTVSGNIAAKYQDVAEWVLSSQKLSAGTVVVLDQNQFNQVIASSQAYDTRVAGVVSIQPGITLGEQGESKVLVATTGRVRIKVDASGGPIRVGDLLVTSDVAGVAMRSKPIQVGGVQLHRPGTLIGKALEPLASGQGEILVLLSLQ
jgi:hypothetical protein